MPLFQQSVLKKYLADLDKAKLTAAWQLFKSQFHNPDIQQNIRAAKEEQYQEGFLRELFVQVLGYTLNPQPHYNLTTEYKNQKDNKKADGAILLNDTVRAVIELKGTDTTDLAKIETQAFSYLHNHKGCTYVITSNFEKLRFYISDATDWQEFNLFTLTEEQFALLYLCLQKDHLLNDIPLTVKQQSLAQEDAITKKLYADYSKFKAVLFEDMVARNPQYDQLELFRKTQKLLDRFLFILFAEDRLLLPPNFIIKIVEDWKQLQKLRIQQSLYERFKLYFSDLVQGNEQEDIFAYNGGLFEPDELLDGLQLNDTILMEGVLTLSRYDYNTEVDVNILGHIFEHSLNEIEELQASIEGKAVDRGKTKRKKDGVFYTPRYITKYMVENTIGVLCKQKKEDQKIVEENYVPGKSKPAKKALVEKLDAYRGWLLELTICDPACGSGAFLNAALEFLIAEHGYVDELSAKLLGHSLVYSDITKDILEHNLYGVDINEEAVEIARLSLWLRTAQKGRKLSNLSSNIKCGNSLIDDPAVAGEKAFNWHREFEAIFEKGGFDVVIGNPPYGSIQEKGNKEYYKSKFLSFQGNLENYCFFTEKFIQLTILQNGKIGLIIPTTWATIPQFESLRKLVLKYKFDSIVELPTKVFSDADLDTLISIITKSFSTDNTVSVIKVSNADIASFQMALNNPTFIKQLRWAENDQHKIDLHFEEKTRLVLEKIKGNYIKLKVDFRVSQGIVPYARDEFYKVFDKEYADEIVDQRLWHSDKQINEEFKKELRGEDVVRYSLNWNGKQWIRYGSWLARPRSPEFFTSPRILVREITRGNKLNAAYTDEEYYNNPGIINIISKEVSKCDVLLKGLLAIINSSFIFRYHLSSSPKANLKTSIPKILISDIENLPIPESSVIINSGLDIYAEKIIELLKMYNKIHSQVLNLLMSKYSGFKLTKKLADWPSLSFKDFLKELEKGKVKLSLSEQSEWMQYFDAEKKKANDLQQLIDKTDSEIDAMVYQLYDLTDEEIAIVEGS